MAISNATRNDVWQKLLDAQRHVQYYQVMSGRHEKRHMAVRFVLLFAGAGSVVTVVQTVDARIQAALGIVIAVTVAWEFVANYARKAAILHAICTESCSIESELRDLWTDIQSGIKEEAEIRRAYKALAARLREVTGWAGQNGVVVDDKVNQRTTRTAYAVMEQQYAN